jgi:hypothetical protein
METPPGCIGYTQLAYIIAKKQCFSILPLGEMGYQMPMLAYLARSWTCVRTGFGPGYVKL